METASPRRSKTDSFCDLLKPLDTNHISGAVCDESPKCVKNKARQQQGIPTASGNGRTRFEVPREVHTFRCVCLDDDQLILLHLQKRR